MRVHLFALKLGHCLRARFFWPGSSLGAQAAFPQRTSPSGRHEKKRLTALPTARALTRPDHTRAHEQLFSSTSRNRQLVGSKCTRGVPRERTSRLERGEHLWFRLLFYTADGFCFAHFSARGGSHGGDFSRRPDPLPVFSRSICFCSSFLPRAPLRDALGWIPVIVDRLGQDFFRNCLPVIFSAVRADGFVSRAFSAPQ